MFEEAIKLIIDELGSTGLLLCGLYFILMRVGRMVADHLYVINHNTTEIANTLRLVAQKYCKK